MPRVQSSSPFLRGTALLGACALSIWVPRIAGACSAPQPELIGSVPADGATYPGNAALMFSGHSITLDAVSVTVDGAPAAFVASPLDAELSQIVAFVEPTPQEGQTVVVSGSFCDPGDCEPVTLTYTAGPHDLAAPAPIAESSLFAVYDHADFVSSGGDCQSDSDLTLYVHLNQVAPVAGEAPVVFSVAWDPDGAGPAGFRKSVEAVDDVFVVALPLVAGQLGGEDPRADVCLEVSAVDVAGNAAEPFQMCPACFFRKDDFPPQMSAPPEPMWTESDGVPGSPCAAESATTGESTDTGETTDAGTTSPTTSAGTSDTSGTSEGTSEGGGATGGDGGKEGCACSSDGGDPSDAGRFLMFALGLGLALLKRRT